MRVVASVLIAAASMTVACGGPTSPSKGPLPVAADSANFVYHYAAGDTVDAVWEEQYHTWATARLGITLPQKIGYYKYTSRQDMGDHTGSYNTNAFADPTRYEIHTLWPTDNHEVVHIYTAQFGRPSNFFNEGIAVAFQVDPAAGDFVPRFNGLAVHEACRQYLGANQLVVPLDRVISGSGFNSISDSVLAYREAGSFVSFVIERYGLAAVIRFFRASSANDDVATIKARFQQAVGVPFAQVEAEWLSMLGGP